MISIKPEVFFPFRLCDFHWKERSYHVTKVNTSRTLKRIQASIFSSFATSRCYALVTPLFHRSISKTTVSRLFSDKAGAVPQSNTAEDPQPRPSFLQRLQIRTSSSRKSSPTGTESRPGSSSSRPSRSPARPSTSHFNDAPVITQAATMQHSLEVATPPSPASKRQRSAEGRETYLTPGPVGKTRSASRTPSPVLPVKIPAFLNKSRGGKQSRLRNDNFYCSIFAARTVSGLADTAM